MDKVMECFEKALKAAEELTGLLKDRPGKALSNVTSAHACLKRAMVQYATDVNAYSESTKAPPPPPKQQPKAKTAPVPAPEPEEEEDDDIESDVEQAEDVRAQMDAEEPEDEEEDKQSE